MVSHSLDQDFCIICQCKNNSEKLMQVRLKGLNTLIEYREIPPSKDLQIYLKEQLAFRKYSPTCSQLSKL